MASRSGACTRVAPAPVVAVSPSHALEYDCTDCGSFLFGHRAHRLRSRPPPRSSSSNSNHHRGSSLGEPTAQRILLVAGSTPLQVPQNEQSALPAEYANATDAEVTSEAVTSVQASEEEEPEEVAEEEEVVSERIMDFVAAGASPSDHSSSTLAEIFRCFICLGKVVDAQLCPCCSKLVCQPCIKRWLTDQKSECPHCRAPLLVSQLVSCRFISEISLEVEKIQGKLGDSPMEKYCPTHDSPLLYFCTTCAVAVCSDCAVLIEDHRNHTFEKLSVAYGRHKKKIRMEAAGLRKRRKELSALVASVDKNIETVLKSKDEAAAELQMAFKRMQSRLEEQLKCKLLALLAQKGSMTQEMELLDTILHELDQQLNSIPKSDLIAQEPNMSRMLQDIRTRTFSDISCTPISPEFTSEVVPSYEHGELILKNYKEIFCQIRPTVFIPGGSPDISEVLLNKDVVYSEPICAAGVTWRLKVYPNGSGASQGTHLSVFLEMVEGGNEPATYEYGIDLLHRTRPNQRISRKFSSDFEEGACWGYYQFFRIDLLEKEGYLQPEEDTITLRFYVRPLSYQQQCQDLRRSLAALQAERDESATQVAVIRRAFAAAFFQRRRRRSSRAGHEHVMFAQTVANPNYMISSTPMRKAAAPHIPTMKQLQLKMQEYNNHGGAAGNMWPQAEVDQEHHHHSACTIESHELSQDQCGDHNEIPNAVDDADEAPSVELVDVRRKLHTPKVGRAQKKLRGRKVHKLTLLAPESAMNTSERLDTGLSVVEDGPSATKMSESTTNGDESSRENGVFSEPAPVVKTNALVEEEKYPYNRSVSGSSTNFCTPEIEDWGNLK